MHQVESEKSVKFADQEMAKLEQCHNMIMDENDNWIKKIKYNEWDAMVAACVITEINGKAMVQGANFTQQ